MGYGRIGKSLANITHRYYPDASITVVDHDPEPLKNTLPGIQAWQIDAVKALEEIIEQNDVNSWIIPALPKHLVFEYTLVQLKKQGHVKQIPVPDIKVKLPFEYRDKKGTLYLSFADFSCPSNCDEPEKYCTVTGLPRVSPLYELLDGIDVNDYRSFVLRSIQLAPGLGGVQVQEVMELISRLKAEGPGRYLICTSCSCHAVMSGIHVTSMN